MQSRGATITTIHPENFKKINFKIGGYLLYNVVLVSAVQQRESALSTHLSPPFWASIPPHPCHPTLGHRRALSWGPGAVQQFPTSYPSYTWYPAVCFNNPLNRHRYTCRTFLMLPNWNLVPLKHQLPVSSPQALGPPPLTKRMILGNLPDLSMSPSPHLWDAIRIPTDQTGLFWALNEIIWVKHTYFCYFATSQSDTPKYLLNTTRIQMPNLTF